MKNDMKIIGLNKPGIRFLLEKLFGKHDAKRNQIIFKDIQNGQNWTSPRLEQRIQSANKYKVCLLSEANSKTKKLYEDIVELCNQILYIKQNYDSCINSTSNQLMIERYKKVATEQINRNICILDQQFIEIEVTHNDFLFEVSEINLILEKHLSRYYSGVIYVLGNQDISKPSISDDYILNSNEYKNYLQTLKEIKELIVSTKSEVIK